MSLPKPLTRFAAIVALGFCAAMISANGADRLLERARAELNCSALRESTAISERLAGKPKLFLCYRGREMSHQKLSYVEFSGESFREYKSREAFAARFAPFNTETSATALALAFTHADFKLNAPEWRDYVSLQSAHQGAPVRASGEGYRVILYERTPQQGQCEVPGLYELLIQTWPDGLKREIKRTKIYERSDKRQICVD